MHGTLMHMAFIKRIESRNAGHGTPVGSNQEITDTTNIPQDSIFESTDDEILQLASETDKMVVDDNGTLSIVKNGASVPFTVNSDII